MRTFVAAWLGSGNLGDELLFACLRRKLAPWTSEITVASAAPSATRRDHDVRAVHHLDLPTVAREIASSDALVFGGGGLLQDSTSPFSLPLHLIRLLIANARRVPVLGIGLGAGPVRRSLSRHMIRRAFRHHRGLAVRDAASSAVLRDCGVGDVTVTADLAFSLPPHDGEPGEAIAVALRAYAEGLLPARWRAARASAEVEATVAGALDEVHARSGAPLRFVAFEGDRDARFHRRIAERMRATAVSFSQPTLETVLDEIGQARAVISMRYHGGVAAALAARPVVLLGYAPKVAALAESLGNDCRFLPNAPGGFRRLAGETQALLGQPGGMKERRDELRRAETGNDELIRRFYEGL